LLILLILYLIDAKILLLFAYHNFFDATFLYFLHLLLKREKIAMKFLKKTLFNKKLGVSVAVSINGSCKADGG